MTRIGGYRYVAISDNGKKFKEINKTNNSKGVYMFVAGGSKIDEKVRLANERLAQLYTPKTQVKPSIISKITKILKKLV